jgi:hypothetical protein
LLLAHWCAQGCAQRRPPPLEPDDRLGADERDGEELDEDGRLAPCEGTLGAETLLPELLLPDPLLVEGLVWLELLLLLDEPLDPEVDGPDE